MTTSTEALSFTDEAEVRMQELAEFLAKDTRVNLTLTSQLHDSNVLLTPGGFLMMAIPLIEGARLGTAEDGVAPSPEAVREAIRGLLEALKAEPAPADANLGGDVRIVVGKRSMLRPMRKPIELGPRQNVRSSFSVIRAFWKRFGSLEPYSG